jgi:LCP family protein required for cell wall assembly
MPNEPAPHRPFARVFLGVTATLALLISAGGGYALVTYVDVKDVGIIQNDPGGSPGSVALDETLGPCADDVCNYLLLGSDSRRGLTPEELEQFGTDQQIGGENRADTIMLVHTDPKLDKVIILSFPRDLWVEIPGHGSDKINAAFEGGVEGGGPELVARTIHLLTGLRINHVLYVDLAGFQGIVQTLGGVDMCIPADQVNTSDGRIVDPLTGLDIAPGCQRLDARQALAYVRTRHLPCDIVPDFARIGRQQQFLRAVINRMLQPTEFVRAPTLIEPILSNIRRDRGLDPADLTFLVGQLRGISTGAAEFRAVPGTPTVNPDGLSIVEMDPSAERIFAAIRDGGPIGSAGTELAGTPPSEANIVAPVVDHSSGGKAEGVLGVLSDSGFDVSRGIVDFSSFGADIRGAVIAYEPGRDAEAQVVGKYFPTLRLVETTDGALDGSPVAVFVTPAYEPQPVGAPGEATGCVDAGA